MKKLLQLLAICAVFVFCAFDKGYAQGAPGQDRPSHSLRVDTDMAMFCSPSTRFFLGWQEDADALFQWGLDGILDRSDLRRPGKELFRVGALALLAGTGYVVSQAFSLTAHDESHMEAARAIGASSVSLQSNDGQEMSVWQFFWEAFNFTVEPGIYLYFKENLTMSEEARVAGEGLDTNMLIADRISQRIDRGAGGIADLEPYVLNKLWGINYFLETGPYSDGANYVSLLNGQGFTAVTARNVILLNAASCLVSGGFLSLVKGACDFIFKGESTVRPLELRIGEVSVFWPEMTAWLNPDNVSLRTTLDAEWGDVMLVRAGLDVPILGGTNPAPELTLGARIKIRRFGMGLELTSRFVKLPLFVGSMEYDLNDTFSLGVEGYYGQGNTMRELREYPLGPGATGFLKVRM
jgi:hypothetical protein